jgi:NAD(P)-dependent dehydrogenase (short-subunit alcohol dehydrogenase family)
LTSASYVPPTTSILNSSSIMLSLNGKVALITGLGQSHAEGWGIGAAIAVLLARQGAKVFGGNRTLASTATTKAAIEAEGGICDVVETDVTSAASTKALVNACLAKHGRIDILINNVGGSEPGCPATMQEDVWDSQVNLNLKSVFLMCQHVLPIMEHQRSGSVVSVSSIAGLLYIGKPQVGYSATKAAIIQLMKTTAVIYAPKGVRLNTIVPGLMDTPYTKGLVSRYAADGQAEAYMEMRNAQVPMGKMGDAWDVANATLFLVSDEAQYITGQELVVDGGITCSTGRT